MTKGSDYRITKETVALEPTYDQYGNLCTIVHESHETYMVTKSPKQIIEENCIFYGCSYEGILESAKQILGIKQMVPIALSVALGLYAMPTCSPESDKCCWLFLAHMKKIERHEKKRAKVIFTDDSSLIIDVHKDTLESRWAKMTLLHYVLTTRIGVYEKWESRLGLSAIWRLL
ncbi:competence protein ComK [Anoxybacillus calidus]|jgi:competence protein ComK|uniref:Competence protein ComK n=1 Tax=[Anoxybacillus] calidus TaxID=575178 RepID=A0A7V9YZN5_9BACL|nr:competence protein ComK [Anoxybacillus calidus]MBA2871257.1 competence protein ComK [Anoxybacillus calidus]